MKKNYFFAAIVLALIILAIVYIAIPKPQLIGGERDNHGCLTAAGYSWNETEQECVRQWISDYSRFQVTNFQQCEDAKYTILETSPRQCKTPSDRLFTQEINNRTCGNGICESGEEVRALCPTSNCQGDNCTPCEMVCEQDCG